MKDKISPKEIERFVSGVVRVGDGASLPNVKVALYAVVVESDAVVEKPISNPEETNDKGEFNIQYRLSDIGKNVERVNLQVRVLDEHDKQLAVLPEIKYNAPDYLEGLELIIPAQPKPSVGIFQELVGSIKRETGVGSLEELSADNHKIITFLSKTLQKDTRIIQQVIQAHTSEVSGLEPAIAFSLLKETESIDLKVTLNMDRRELNAKINIAVSQGDINPIGSEELEKNIDLIIAQKAKQILELPNYRKYMAGGDAILLGIQSKNKAGENRQDFCRGGRKQP